MEGNASTAEYHLPCANYPPKVILERNAIFSREDKRIKLYVFVNQRMLTFNNSRKVIDKNVKQNRAKSGSECGP